MPSAMSSLTLVVRTPSFSDVWHEPLREIGRHLRDCLLQFRQVSWKLRKDILGAFRHVYSSLFAG